MKNIKLKRSTLWICSATILFMSMTDFVMLDNSKNKDISYFLLGLYLPCLIVKSKKNSEVYPIIYILGISAIAIEVFDYFILGLNPDYYFGVLYLAFIVLAFTSFGIVKSIEANKLDKRKKTKFYIFISLIYISGYVKHYLS